MTRPTVEKPTDTDFSVLKRREALKALAATGAIAGLGLGACTQAAVAFPQGVASGDPTQDALVIWTRAFPEGGTASVTGAWDVAEDDAFARIVKSGAFTTGPERDFTVKVDVSALSPAAQVFYRFRVGAAVSPIGRGRTLPEGDVPYFKLALFSCSNYASGYFNAYRHCAERDDIDLALHVGDYIYEYGSGKFDDETMKTGARGVLPTHDIVSLADYRARYAHYRADPDLQEIHRRVTFITVWDDHESANDAWMDGAQNHHPDQGAWRARRANAVRAYFEWMPLRPLEPDSAQRTYRSFSIGNLASLIVLDTRLYGRDRQLNYGSDLISEDGQPDWDRFQTLVNDPNRSILGAEQEAWLDTELRQAKRARWRILGQQTLMGLLSPPDMTALLAPNAALSDEERDCAEFYAEIGGRALPLMLDSLGGSYRGARERILNAATAAGGNTIVLSGDSHNAWAFNLKDRAGRIAAVEVGGTSVTSPGLEAEMPLNIAAAERATVAKNAELTYCKLAARGYAVVELQPDVVHVEHVFIDTVMTRTFAAHVGKRLRIDRKKDGTTAAFTEV